MFKLAMLNLHMSSEVNSNFSQFIIKGETIIQMTFFWNVFVKFVELDNRSIRKVIEKEKWFFFASTLTTYLINEK